MGESRTKDEALDADVIVVGAGPVGLSLALNLAQRGVRTAIFERKDAPAFLPKMERCNARSMEIFRRLNLADEIRAASRFRDIPMDVFIVTDLTEPPLVQLKYPSVTASIEATRQCRDASMPLEPYQLISQYTLEPLLKRHAEADDLIDVRYSSDVLSFEQDDDGVRVTVDVGQGRTQDFTARYLVGCDGGPSTVRKALGIKLEGRGRIVPVHQIFFRSEDLFDRIVTGHGRHYYSPSGVMVVQDDLKHFMLNVHHVEPTLETAAGLVHDFLGMPVELEVLHVSSWWQHLLVAEQYADGRVFLAGDANHLYIPTGGLGMNTGIGDQDNLAWKLAAAVQGWAGPGLLASYDQERRKVGRRNRDAAGAAADGLKYWRSVATPDFWENTPAGRDNRQLVADTAAVRQRLVHEMVGTELGYCYDESPVICHESGDSPDVSPTAFVPSTFPGVRLPHVWLADGTAVADRLGLGFTLLRLGAAQHDTSALEAAVRATGAPLDVLDIAEAHVRELYERDLLLIRPDLHVAWRGDLPPADPQAVAAAVTGVAAVPAAAELSHA
ncbi:MAG: FAD-dependent oxidoreductase [Actinomycetota bacterium]|nr:MAG: FAD-dependent oxidoreductase [Actinomycetota bacterium]